MDSSRPSIPQDLRDLMAEIGPQWSPALHVKLMLDRFSEVHRAGTKEGVKVKRDLAYGPHERHRLDVYLPDDAKAQRTAVLFAHGGAFLDGHRNRTEEIYANVLHYFARHGIVGINIGYRLADAAKYPGASDDIAAVVAWTHARAAEFGIANDRIFLMGHSAGAAHTGSYAYDARRHLPGGPGLAGHLVISGRVRAETLPENPNAQKVAIYYATDDAAVLSDLSPVSHVSAQSIPTFIAFAEFENRLLDLHCLELAHRLAQARRHAPPLLWLRGHNHTSMIGHINTAEDRLGRAMLEFIADPR
jgi:acetyl esterase/lipase